MATYYTWNPFGVALEVTASGANVVRKSATQFTVSVTAEWKTYYTGAATNYGMDATSGGSTVTISSFGTSRSSGSKTFTGAYSISGNGAATKTITVTFRNYNTDNGKSATKNVTFNVSVPAWTSYTIAYNANGGTGAPGNQTKWNGQALTLSSTKPLRTGYSFLGWSTSSTATSATYSAGGSYTSDSAATLYAVWRANTYTVKYNANGGTGAPGNQTKTYGQTLKLSTTAPTRTNYTFKGWGTSASSTTVSYAAGANYTKNSAITLYAIWELAYIKPRISNVSVERCNSNAVLSDDGTNALLVFDWECDKTISSIVVKWKQSIASTWTSATVSTSGGTSGRVSYVFGSNSLNTENTYDIHFTVSDASGSSYATASLVSMRLPLDVLNGGKGVSFGKTAELENTAEFEFDAKFNNDVYGNALGMNRLPEIKASEDFNSYIQTGCYAVYTDSNAATIANIPVKQAGRLEVWSSTGDGNPGEHLLYLRQKYVPYTISAPVWERDIKRTKEDVWVFNDWVRTGLSKEASTYVYGDQKVLWGDSYSTGWYMKASHSVTLSERVDAQRHGIVLVFSFYSGEDNTNKHWKTFFIPKEIVYDTGKYHTFFMCENKFSYIGTKYISISNTELVGHDDNTSTGTANGITYANNKFVLRYVIGV